MNQASLIQGAFPRDTAKHLERELGCTRRQAQRIAETGRVPSRLWTLAERIIEKALEANEERIREARETLKAIRVERMLDRAADNRAGMAVPSPAGAAVLDSEADAEPTLPSLIDTEAA